ncbi:YciI family protein [Calidifontibacter terrae]
MSKRYLVLLPAPEAEWAKLPPEEHEKGMRAHERFARELAEGGHRVITASPLTDSANAVSMRPDGQGGTTITDGPFTESTEQIVGFYLIESDDRAALLKICAQLSSTGDLIEFRDLESDDGPHPAGDDH